MTDHTERDKADHAEYAQWDAAYVLGALSSAQRHEFEQHLSVCKSCTAAVTELAAMPGLLGELPVSDAFAMLEADAAGAAPHTGAAVAGPPPVSILNGLTARVRRRRRARAWTVGVVSVAAAAAIAAAIVLPMSLNAPVQPTVSAALQQVTPSPISASVHLTSVKWGTKIAVDCTYGSSLATSSGYSGYSDAPVTTARSYSLYVTDRHGTTTRVASWRAGPGSVVHATGSIDTNETDVATVELRATDSGTVLLSRAFA